MDSRGREQRTMSRVLIKVSAFVAAPVTSPAYTAYWYWLPLTALSQTNVNVSGSRRGRQVLVDLHEKRARWNPTPAFSSGVAPEHAEPTIATIKPITAHKRRFIGLPSPALNELRRY
jgi:hypothetical protein